MTTLDELLLWCSSLVRTSSQSDKLELAHFTVKEYLMDLKSPVAQILHNTECLLIIQISLELVFVPWPFLSLMGLLFL